MESKSDTVSVVVRSTSLGDIYLPMIKDEEEDSDLVKTYDAMCGAIRICDAEAIALVQHRFEGEVVRRDACPRDRRFEGDLALERASPRTRLWALCSGALVPSTQRGNIIKSPEWHSLLETKQGRLNRHVRTAGALVSGHVESSCVLQVGTEPESTTVAKAIVDEFPGVSHYVPESLAKVLCSVLKALTADRLVIVGVTKQSMLDYLTHAGYAIVHIQLFDD